MNGMAERHENRRDAELRHELTRALGEEALLGQCSIHPDGDFELPRALVLFPEGAAGMIRIDVDRGAVILRGRVPLAAQRDLAAAVASRVPGCHRVINELRVGS